MVANRDQRKIASYFGQIDFDPLYNYQQSKEKREIMMASPLLRRLAEEKVVLLKSLRELPFVLKGIVRLVDKGGHTLGLLLDKATLDEIQEDTEASNPAFVASIKKSRLSGRVSGKSVKKRIGL